MICDLFHRRSILSLALLGFAASPASAVILYKSATPNTAAPTGSLANSGWQWAGQFGGFMGTAVAPHYFLTAQHIGGGSTFTLNGVNYDIDTSFNVSGPGYASEPNTDLRLWKTVQAMPTYAPLYDTTVDGTEVGKNMVVIGRGTLRGDPVYAETSQSGGSSSRANGLRGWLWGASTGQQSWGTNKVSYIADGGATLGSFLAFNFDADGTPDSTSDEGALSFGDSGGPVFVQTGSGQWKLAGINYGADGPWRYTPPSSSDTGSAGDSPFYGSLFDASGLYILADAQGNYQYIPDDGEPQPGSSYASEVSPNVNWIEQYIDAGNAVGLVPEPASVGTVLIGAMALRRRRKPMPAVERRAS